MENFKEIVLNSANVAAAPVVGAATPVEAASPVAAATTPDAGKDNAVIVGAAPGIVAGATGQKVASGGTATASTPVVSNPNPPITIVMLGVNHHLHSAFYEKLPEEIERLHKAKLKVIVTLEKSCDINFDFEIATYLKNIINNDPKLADTYCRMLEYCCSIGPRVTEEQLKNFLNTKCPYNKYINERYPEFLKKVVASLNATVGYNFPNPADRTPEIYERLCTAREISFYQFLKSSQIPSIGIDINRAKRVALQNVCHNLASQGLSYNSELMKMENTRIQTMMRLLCDQAIKLQKTGGIIFIVDLGTAHLRRLSAWLQREKETNPQLRECNLSLKPLKLSCNRPILNRAGQSPERLKDYAVSMKLGLDMMGIEGTTCDSDEIKARIDQTTVQDILFTKNDKSDNFEVTCPEFSALIGKILAEHQVYTKHNGEEQAHLTTAAKNGGAAAATDVTTAAQQSNTSYSHVLTPRYLICKMTAEKRKLIESNNGKVISSDLQGTLFELPAFALKKAALGGIRDKIGLVRVLLRSLFVETEAQLKTNVPGISFEKDNTGEGSANKNRDFIVTFDEAFQSSFDQVMQPVLKVKAKK